jgi:DNA helicase-2/ATP-dependent DNA helicase PcrA
MNLKEKLQQQFNDIYAQLNPQQKIAVDSIEGPVMVIAGPGTGKTQILSARIGKILLETDAAPENILCLTYTDAGALAMRKRLQKMIGSDAYRVQIHTYHSFCNDVIQDNLSLFEKNNLDPISELERTQLFKKLIDAFPKNHPLKRYRGDVYFEINNLQKLFSNMKREGWAIDYLIKSIDNYINDLPNRDEYIAKKAVGAFKKGDVRTDKIIAEAEIMDKLKAAILEFENFQTLMKRANRYDFDDMINWVINAFEQNENLLRRYQEQYQYILVDEYQDTSGTQNKLVELLISFWDVPNVFVVGDDDQSIFRFQGANVENMEHFIRKYDKDLLKIVLTNNYRSTQKILDSSKTIIEKNNERLVNKISGLSKNLVASNTSINTLQTPLSIHQYQTQKHEMIGITLAVETLIKSGIQPGNIGVIYKENKYGDELTRFFNLKEIPVYSKRSVNIFEIPLAKKIILLLKYLSAEHDIPFGGDEMLFEILHFDWWGIPAIEVAKLSVEVADKQFGADKTSIRKLLIEKSNAPQRDLFQQPFNEAAKNASVVLESLISDVPNVTLQSLVELIIQKTGLLNYILNSNEKHWHLQVLTGLFDFIKEESRRNTQMQLEDIVTIIELMQKEEIKLPLVQISGNEKGVNLLTAHGSKGLEFKYVFFAGCNSGSWEKKRKPNNGYRLPDTIFETTTADVKTTDAEELRRLFYVALTRAETNLQLSYAQFQDNGKELEPSKFVVEIAEEHELSTDVISLPTTVTTEFEILLLSKSLMPEIAKAETDFIDTLLDKFTMNVTALNNYLNCPLQFYYNNLIRVPSGKNESTEFGSAVHHALEQLFQKMQDNSQQQFPDKAVFIADFDFYMKRNRESFTKEQFNRRIEYGHEVLTNYYDKYSNSFNKIVAIERSIKNVVVQGVPLKGKLDKLEFDGKSVNVVDYKSGNYENALSKLKPPHDKEPNGGSYWRQAVFYKILVDNYQSKDWKVVSTEFDFIEPDKKKEYQKEKIIISAADIETVTNQITITWQKIQNREFYKGCGEEDCKWCNFVKTNNLSILSEEIEEEN